MKIVLLSTGGTIAMEKESARESSSMKHDASYFAEQLPLSEGDDLRLIDYSRLPSSNFDSEYASLLAEQVEKELEKSDGLIITHGTDTMEETAFYLELTFKSEKPVILTGSMNTAGQPAYDGISNLRDALKVVKAGASCGKGVLIVFNRDIISAVHGVKCDSERLSAFGSMQTGKMGAISGDRVLYYYGAKDHIKLENRVSGRVSIIKVHYDIEEDFVDNALSLSDIVVFETLGSGRIPPKVVPVIERHTSQGKIVILSSTAASGHLYDEYDFEGSYRYFLNSSVIMSQLNSKKSCILARLCLGNGKGQEEIKHIFESFWD